MQRDKYWTKLEGKFTINLFLYSEEIEVALGRKAVVDPLVSNSWTLTTRLPYLVSGKDDWWFITEKTDIDTISSQITEMWRTQGAQWFDQHRSVTDFIRAFESKGGSIWPEILLYNHIGDRKKTRFLLFKYLSNASDINEDQVLWITANKYITESRSKEIRLAVIQDRETSRRRVAELLEIEENT